MHLLLFFWYNTKVVLVWAHKKLKCGDRVLMLLWIIFYFVLGSVIGSFINLCACRLPLGRSIVWGRSACDSCGHPLAVFDLLPVFSYVFLQGRCRYCNAAYGSSHLITEVLTGVLFVLCGLQVLPGLKLLLLFALTACLILISLIDLQLQIIPDNLAALIALGGIVYSILYLPGGIAAGLSGSALGFGIMLAIFVISSGGMGGGDVKLSAALGLWLGFEYTAIFLLLAFCVGGLFSILLLIFDIKGRQDAIPFGPFLCAAAFAALLYGKPLADYYWKLFYF